MATSPLLGGNRPAQRPSGTGTDALGPSDSSDTGSDIQGAVGAVDTDATGLNADDVRRAPGAGADIGDANLDSDSDRSGTGERAEAGRDTLRREAPDIGPDRIEGTGDVSEVDELAVENDTEAPEGGVTAQRQRKPR
jgi:hypothetical protein